MSGGKRSRVHCKIAVGVAGGAILLAGWVVENHSLRAGKFARSSLLNTIRTPRIRTSFPAPPPAPQAFATGRAPKASFVPKSQSPELRPTALTAPEFSLESRERAMETNSALPMMFEANNGQTDPRVKFLSRAPGYTLFLTDREAVLSLPSGLQPTDPHAGQHSALSSVGQVETRSSFRAVRLKFAGGNTPPTVTGRHQLPGKTSYFIGNDSKKWRADVANYEGVEYQSIYPGVDAVFHGDNQRLEFDFDVSPGTDPSVIALEVRGAKRIRLNREGDVVLRMDAKRDVVLGKPIVYQQSPEGRREIAGNFVFRGKDCIGFSLGRYNHSLPLVIDPTLVYSTYLGGGNIYPNSAANDSGKAIAVDSYGYVYVVGTTASSDFPVTAGAFETNFPQDVTGFVTKLNPTGSALIYSTYFGNAVGGGTTITGIAVDAAGDAYLTGNTNSGFPTTPGAFKTSGNTNGSYAFATELNSAGTDLVYSTLLGGTDTTPETTYAYGIAVDSGENAYVVGYTTSPTYSTTPGALQPTQGCTPTLCGGNGFVTKVNAGGATLAYSTYLGTGSNKVEAVAVDSFGDAFVVGSTGSKTFPVTSGAFQTSSSDSVAAFVTKLNPTGTALLYSTLLSGSNTGSADEALAVAVDTSGDAFVTGQVGDSDFPTTVGAFQRSLLDHSDAFVTELNPTGSGLVYSTYLPGLTTGYGIGVNSLGEAYVSGTNYGNAGTFPTTPDAFQTSSPTTTTNGFLTVLNSAGSGLVYSTYIGVTSGNMIAYAYALALDSGGNAYITGAAPPSFPTTPGAFKTTLTANTNYPNPQNAYIMKFAFAASQLTISPTALSAGTTGVPYGPVTLTAAGGTGTVTFAVTTASLPSNVTLSPSGVISGTPTQAGKFPFTITATDSIGDTGSQPYTLIIAAACSTISVSPSTLASGTVDAVYSTVTFTQTGGVGIVTFSEMGALPTGMTFVAGVLSGTPTQTGSFRVTVTATDSNGCTGSTTYTLTINSSTGPPPPAMVTDNETISVTDTVTFPDIADSEKITLTDTVLLTLSAGATKTATTTAISSTSASFDGFSLPTNVALVNTTQVPVSFTVKPASGSALPTGTVIVTDGFNDTCSATLNSTSAGAGSCALTISQVGSGSTSLTAAYTPDSSASSSGLLASSSSAVTENVVQIVSCGPLPAPTTVSEGATAKIPFTVCLAGDVNAVPTAVTSDCLSNATCTLAVTAVAGKAGAYTVTLSVATPAGSVLVGDPQPRSGPWPLVLFALSMLLFLWVAFLLARHPGGRLRLVYSAGLLLALAGISGCTSASLTGPSKNNGGGPVGNFKINVQVNAGNFSTTVPLSLTVTK